MLKYSSEMGDFFMDIYENKEICQKCGGYCCKKCGCDYFVSDFTSIKLATIEDALNTGRISIVSALDFKRINKKLTVSPILYLRERNVGREDIDLLSFKTKCASLTYNGCIHDYETRPSGGKTLIPKEDGNCYSEVSRIEELNKWLPYQNILSRVVKRRTGKTVLEKLKEDVTNLFYDILTRNFDGVMDAELIDVLGMVPLLEEVYEDALFEARKLKKEQNILKRTK